MAVAGKLAEALCLDSGLLLLTKMMTWNADGSWKRGFDT
jgi:hypothetical protein